MCGMIDKDEYDHYDLPSNGDMHTVVPGKFVAFRGPIALAGGAEYQDLDGYREFSPKYYVDCFKDMRVTTVIRLNEPHYEQQAFEAHGIQHVELEFDDCTAPPDRIVARFFRAVDAAPGVVAVHCKAGLGRTGTLIALYLMRRHRFTAREAMGWLRIMRPGSVIGDQQHYLCAVEEDVRAAFLRRASTPGVSPAASPTLSPSISATLSPPLSPPLRASSGAAARTRSSGAESAGLAREVEAAMRRRGAARGAAARVGPFAMGSGTG
jgi:protein-tyrosine phosphatase